ncbi:MAG: ORF6N domain-containing protein [Bacteroidales bacterium]|nr:ORF6N domain-containing protein [Bacteroidales bacterium]
METEVIAKKGNRSITSLIEDVEEKIVVIRNQQVIADADVAVLYGVQTKDINRAVRNNPDKFPPHYMFELTISELRDMRLKILTTNVSSNSHSPTKVFTERGLYMLATILKGERARAVTFAIIETFAQIRELKRELLEMHQETDKDKQKAMMQHFGEVLTDLVMPDLQTSETESSLEINFFIGKLKHTVKRVRKED